MPWSNQSGGGNGGGGPWGPSPGGGKDGKDGGGSPWGRPPGGNGNGKDGGPNAPDLEALLRKGRERLARLTGGGGGWAGGRGIGLVLGVLALLWAATGIYRVQPDEQGVVLRFGQYARTESPGLRYHLPAPLEKVMLPKVGRQNIIEIGYRTSGPLRAPEAAQESLMLTGDENIIDINFTVYWRIKDAGQYLFEIRDPDGTVKMAAESAMREIIGRTEIQPALTEARQEIERGTRTLLQTMLDEYRAGVEVVQVQLQKVDPPAQVVDAFNDVQRARQDRERTRNEAESYRNKIIPEARGEAERLEQEALAYREQVLNLAQGDSQRFLKVLEIYQTAPEVTARRLYLETMQEVLGSTNKVIVQGKGNAPGAIPLLSLNDLLKSAPAAAPAGTR